MPNLPTVREYMDTVVVTLRPDLPIWEAVDLLLERRVTGAPVLDESGALVGMLSETDCLKLLALRDDEGLPPGGRPPGTVADFMSRSLTTVPPRMDIYYAAGVFLAHNFRRLPVVEGGRLVGAITRFDILRAIQKNLA